MFSEGNDYDRGVNTFNPDGRLFQVEYAIEAIKLGSTVIAIQTSEGIAFGAEKRVGQKCLVASSIKKVVEISKVHVGAVSGLTADGDILIDKGRVEAQNYRFTYDEDMRTESLARRLCDFSMDFGSEGAPMSRPLGVAMLLGGLDRVDGGKKLVPRLFHLDPSGTLVSYRAKAIGAGAETAMSELSDEYNTSMSIKEAQNLIVRILKNVMEEKVTQKNVDLWTIEIVQDMESKVSPSIRKVMGDDLQIVLDSIDA